ncbi:MAG: flagellar FliJ family protein [Rhodospirillales bacterium]|nr:flagellar FliJ family protein [Rhodospirillales bacterium]MCW8860963.1 flagellar FliJ family protein [Rhodospirillales bacterium]MCW8951476.1 flagellar FliJ family protein [Rhodospirillales bacterium]MCW8970750.1 flagellar FliJ family protein [Rhodospirillales bacterium]MCW9001343.1 flagellar FliJ family protein [Rhodospirillales bacterium]
MAKSLKTLIRLHEWLLDEKRRALGEHMRQLDLLETGARNLESEIVEEKVAAGANPTEGGITYGGYARAAIKRRKHFSDAIATKEGEIDVARDHVIDAFQDVKTFEITQETRDRTEAEERERVERIFLDEIGLENYRRKTRAQN